MIFMLLAIGKAAKIYTSQKLLLFQYFPQQQQQQIAQTVWVLNWGYTTFSCAWGLGQIATIVSYGSGKTGSIKGLMS